MMNGDFSVVAGDTLKILVGEKGIRNGGGGGTFVTDLSNNPIIIAGGGGGSSSNLDSPDKNGQTGTTGGTGAGGGGTGGTAGNGGNVGPSFASGAGGGLLTNGADGWIASSGGIAFVNGGAGANVGYGVGGFGCGGNGSGNSVGGGGGGYSGGGGGSNSAGGGGVGGGGGSYNGGANQINTSGVNTGNGLVIISYNSASCTDTTGTDVQTACDSFTWIDGITYTSSNNTATDTLTNVGGCDSIVTLNLTINNSNTGTDSVFVCDSYTSPSGNYTWSTTGTYFDTVTNTVGCDSIITIHLTIAGGSDSIQSANFTINQLFGGDTAGCAPFSAMFMDVTYTQFDSLQRSWDFGDGSSILVSPLFPYLDSPIPPGTHPTPMFPGGSTSGSYKYVQHYYENPGTYEVKLVTTNIHGCKDSITKSIVVYESPVYSTDIQNACDSYLWIDGITYTASTNTPTDTLTNVYGCDSIVTLNLTINIDTTDVFDTTFVTIYDTTDVFDTTQVMIYDTTFVTVYDTTFITVHDTTYVSVTDTLFIDVTITGVSPPNNINTIKVYPNPANDIVYIDNGNYMSMSNYTIKIVNDIGQEIFNSNVNTQQFMIPVSTFGAEGLYFIQIIDNNGTLLDTRKLVLN